jgi:long-chain acyl-CoA synthetase
MANFLTTGGDRVAVIASTEVVTYGQLDDTSSRLAEVFYAAGLTTGDRVAVLLENGPRWFEVLWAAMRSGLYVVPINWHLHVDEVRYVIEDSGARAVVTSAHLADLVPDSPNLQVRLVTGGTAAGFESYEARLAGASRFAGPETEGAFMFYSSGTTGRPKGIKPSLAGEPFGDGGGALVTLLGTLYQFDADTIYLSPAPLYHAAPIGWSSAVHRCGGTS